MIVYPVRTRYLKLEEQYRDGRVVPNLLWKSKDAATKHFQRLHDNQQKLLEGDLFQNTIKALIPSFPALRAVITTSIRRHGHHKDLVMESTNLPSDSKFGYTDHRNLSAEQQALRTFWVNTDPVPSNIFAPSLVHHTLLACSQNLKSLSIDCFSWRFLSVPVLQPLLDRQTFRSLEELELRWNGYTWGFLGRRTDAERMDNIALLRNSLVTLLAATPKLRALCVSLQGVDSPLLHELLDAEDRFTMNCTQIFGIHTWTNLVDINLGNVDIDYTIIPFLKRHKLRELLIGNAVLTEPGEDWFSFLERLQSEKGFQYIGFWGWLLKRTNWRTIHLYNFPNCSPTVTIARALRFLMCGVIRSNEGEADKMTEEGDWDRISWSSLKQCCDNGWVSYPARTNCRFEYGDDLYECIDPWKDQAE